MSAASTVVSYLTALALKRAQHLDRLHTDEANQQMFAAMTDLQNTLTARAQTDQVLRRLQEDVAGGEVERRTQARLQLAIEDLLERDPEFERGVTDTLNRLRALDIARARPFLRDAERAVKESPGLGGIIRPNGSYTEHGINFLNPFVALAGAAVIVVGAGTVIVIDRGNDGSRAPGASQANEEDRAQQGSLNGAADDFGVAVPYRSPDGYRYEAMTTQISRVPEIGEKSAPPGSSFLALTIKERNLQTDRTVSGQLADKYGAGAVAVIFPSARASTDTEEPETRSCTVPGAEGSGYLVREDAARGRPVGSCMYQMSWDFTQDQASMRMSADGDPYTEIPAGASNDLSMVTTTYFDDTTPLQDASVFVTFADSEKWYEAPLP